MLLDTHVVLWMLADDPKFGSAARAAMSADPDILVSTASLWEIAIKQTLGKLEVPSDIVSRIEDAGVQWLDVGATHAWGVSEVEGLAHHDPFDRLLIAQAGAEGATFMTADRTLLDFRGTPSVRTIDARL